MQFCLLPIGIFVTVFLSASTVQARRDLVAKLLQQLIASMCAFMEDLLYIAIEPLMVRSLAVHHNGDGAPGLILAHEHAPRGRHR